MTVAASIPNPVFLDADGVTTAFPFSFYLLETSHLTVKWIDGSGTVTSPSLGVDFSVTAVPSVGGTVTFLPGSIPPDGTTVMLARIVDVQQPAAFTAVSYIDLATLERSIDRLAMEIDTLKEAQSRRPAFRLESLAELRSMEIPQFDGNALKLFQVNATEDGLTYLASALHTATPDAVSQLVFTQDVVEITPDSGDVAQAAASFVPAGITLLDVGGYVKTTLGNGNGLTTWSLGTLAEPARFASGKARTATTVTNSGEGGPIVLERVPTALDIYASADSGTFDGTGVIVLTYSGFYLTPLTTA